MLPNIQSLIPFLFYIGNSSFSIYYVNIKQDMKITIIIGIDPCIIITKTTNATKIVINHVQTRMMLPKTSLHNANTFQLVVRVLSWLILVLAVSLIGKGLLLIIIRDKCYSSLILIFIIIIIIHIESSSLYLPL